MRVSFGNRINKQGLWEAGFVVIRGWGKSGSYGTIWLICLNSSVVDRKLNSIT